jgi:hypothetical protein
MAIIDGKIRCSDCKQFVQIENFSPSAQKRGHGVCNPCHAIRAKSYQERYPEKYKESQRKTAAKHPETRKRVHAKWRAENKDAMHGYHVKLKFGLSREEYSALLEKQGGACALCGKPKPPQRRLLVDHCHETGKVRGLLCIGCNTAIGQLGDNVAGLTKAIEYLEGNTSWQTN